MHTSLEAVTYTKSHSLDERVHVQSSIYIGNHPCLCTNTDKYLHFNRFFLHEKLSLFSIEEEEVKEGKE